MLAHVNFYYHPIFARFRTVKDGIFLPESAKFYANYFSYVESTKNSNKNCNSVFDAQTTISRRK